jgi:hypothetical protein
MRARAKADATCPEAAGSPRALAPGGKEPSVAVAVVYRLLNGTDQRDQPGEEERSAPQPPALEPIGSRRLMRSLGLDEALGAASNPATDASAVALGGALGARTE